MKNEQGEPASREPRSYEEGRHHRTDLPAHRAQVNLRLVAVSAAQLRMNPQMQQFAYAGGGSRPGAGAARSAPRDLPVISP